MTIRPIIFSSQMVLALLDGRKTQTRRLATSPLRKCAVGDFLYVRECWAAVNSGIGPGWAYAANSQFIQPEFDGPDYGGGPSFDYEKYPGQYSMWFDDLLARAPDHKWTPSIHQPRWASRLTLRVTDIRFEPLQSISEHDAKQEGCDARLCGHEGPNADPIKSFRTGFVYLWNSLHQKPGSTWADNPALVALSFEVIEGNVDRLPAVFNEKVIATP